jgi:serine/threonine protein kinase/tetratricopeptide (TPR) repeat protein
MSRKTDTSKQANDGTADSGDVPETQLRLGQPTLGLGVDAGSVEDVPDDDLPRLGPGEQLAGRFSVLRFIARGGMGAVYEANDVLLRTRVALKVLQGRIVANEEVMERFRREVLLARRVSHPNVCRVYELYQSTTASGAACHFLTMEFLEGETLAARLSRTGRLSTVEALPLVQQMCDGLAAAHAEGVIHRDFKSSNVMLVPRSGEPAQTSFEGNRVAITDFGIARALVEDAASGGLTLEASILGTPEYMAPEQVTGRNVSVATDVYALGVVLYEMVTGRLPFSAATPLATAARRLHEPPPKPEALVPELDTRWSRTILRCLEREQQKRFQRMADVREALSAPPARRKPASGGTPKAGRAAEPGHPSIAVLPFVDMSPEHNQGYFSDGVAQEIINALAQVPGLHVAARSSSFSFKDKHVDLRTVGQKLDVAHVLEGSVRKSGNRLRVTAQLVGAANGYQLWSRSFDSELADVFTVQDEIASAVVTALKMTVLPKLALARKATSPEAYTHYLRGVQLQNTGSVVGLRQAIEEYDKALAVDASYAPAHARIAEAGIRYGFSIDAGGQEWVRRAVTAADRAVELDPNGVAGLVARGLVRTVFSWDWAGASADLERAIALGPGDEDARRRYATLLSALGRLPEAIESARMAVDLDPVSAEANYTLGQLYNQAEQYALARSFLLKALESSPDHTLAARDLGFTELLDDHPDRALELYRRHEQAWVREFGTALALHSLGEEANARAALEHFIISSGRFATYQVAQVYAWRGEVDAAFEWLERARQEGDGGVRYFKCDPLLRTLRGDARFGEFLRKLKLPVD